MIFFAKKTMNKATAAFLIILLLIQIGCSSVSQITLPIDTKQNEQEVRLLNYFGNKLSSTIYLVDSTEIEASWLILKENKVSYLSNNPNDPPSLNVERIKSIKFYDWWRGCLFGGMGGVFSLGVIGMLGITHPKNKEANYGLSALVLSLLPVAYGVYALSEKEFILIRNNSLQE